MPDRLETVRPATRRELALVARAADQFCRYHGITPHPDAATAIARATDLTNRAGPGLQRARRLRSLWRRWMGRLTKSPAGVRGTRVVREKK